MDQILSQLKANHIITFYLFKVHLVLSSHLRIFLLNYSLFQVYTETFFSPPLCVSCVLPSSRDHSKRPHLGTDYKLRSSHYS